jgi:hypothetical protein
MMRPVNPPLSRLRATIAPTEPVSALAPIRAIARGENSASRLRVVIGFPNVRRSGSP